jgi:hypothetical protein
MIRRPLVGAAVLCGALLLAACNGSPEAGRVTPAPTTSSPTTTPTVGTPTTTPAWTEEELTAIAGAKARYVAARVAVDKAMQDPRKSTRAALEKAGNGGSWIIAILDGVNFKRNNGWYQAGTVQIASTTVDSVSLGGEQPEVRLTVCVDSSRVSTRYQVNGKPVPMGPSDGNRHKAHARIVFAPPANQTAKMWFLIEEKASGTC